jgi:hypothetical protein
MAEVSEKQKGVRRNRFIITTVVLVTFLLIMVGIGIALFSEAAMGSEWKEILLLVLGAFIASYGKIIDFWFNASDDDGVPGESITPYSDSQGPSYCDNCGDVIDYDKF